MLFKKLPHLLIALLVSIVIGCASSNPLADEAQSNIENQNYQAALASAEKAIEQYPDDPLGYYYKAVALGEIAGDQEDPAARAEYYEKMNESFEEAEQVASKAEKTPGEIERIGAVKNLLWQTEHNRAVELATDDSLKATVNDPLGDSMQHLKNATIVQPDSLLSWNVLSQVAAMNQEYNEAASAKQHYMDAAVDTTLETQDFMQLASYYYQLDDQQKVLEVFEDAAKLFPEDEEIISNLADAYNRTGQPEKAISTVEKLVEQDPENPQYRLVLGTQIYQQALTYSDTISTNRERIEQLQQEGGNEQQIAELEAEIERLQPKVDELTNNAEKELNTALEYREDDDAAYNTLGIIYQNRAKDVFEERNRTADNQKAMELDKKGKELLEKSMGYYEKAAEIDPENQEYWRSLFSIYTTLGMDEKARDAMEKAGMQ
jgi:tetratricopeptide (TPR) repeat protein